jgi:hypothetical protein
MLKREEVLFEVTTPMGFRVRVTKTAWDVLVSMKHPVMAGHEMEVKDVLETPEEVRRSRSDHDVFLFYRGRFPGRWVCAVSKKTGKEGFLITAYPTDAIKEGEKIWPK